MEFVILGVLFLLFLLNLLVMRLFFKRLSDKINFISQDTPAASSIPTPTDTSFSPSSLYPNSTKSLGMKPIPADAPVPNQLGEDENDVEFNEQNFSSLPKDVKVNVEGGDVHTPPGFEESKKA